MPEATRSVDLQLRVIGRVESALEDPHGAPRQPDEGAPEAWLAFDPAYRDGLRNLRPGDEVLLFTWLHLAPRDVLLVQPRDDPARALTGVFSTRSPARPNPIGMHQVEIMAVEGDRVHVRHLEAVDGTPIVDLKPVLSCSPKDR